MEETKVFKFKLNAGYNLTGREISSKLVISKNKNNNGNNTTLLMKRSEKSGNFFFVPIADIYLDYNNKVLIMPKYLPVYVNKNLYRDIIPSVKYPGFYVLSPDSDINTIFREIKVSNGKIIWILSYVEITFYLYSWYETIEDEYYFEYLTNHEKIKRIKEERSMIEDDYEKGGTEALIEEAGYDFTDRT